MNDQHPNPAVRLIFVVDFTEQQAAEARDRGYLSHVLVELDNDLLYPVFFYDPIRLKQDIDEMRMQGKPFIADPGMIIVAEVTREIMRAATDELAARGFFSCLMPTTKERIQRAGFNWPPP